MEQLPSVGDEAEAYVRVASWAEKYGYPMDSQIIATALKLEEWLINMRAIGVDESVAKAGMQSRIMSGWRCDEAMYEMSRLAALGEDVS